MELDDLLELIDHVSSSKLDDFCYEAGNMKLRLKKNAAKEVFVSQEAVQNMLPERAIAGKCADDASAGSSKKSEEGLSDKYIDSPLVGIFYTAPGEGEEPFVRVGDRIKKGQTIGIVEAMKLMHEITSEKSGIIKEICAENGAAVEYGQKLFVIAQD